MDLRLLSGKCSFVLFSQSLGDESALNRQKLLNESNFTPSWD
ncbi:hypothetical protein N9Y85_03565 [Paracoccaceae bacterium]|nr:hypothetical protein [Paracoccaceae bacterium]